MCEKSLEYLKRAVYIMIDPDMDERGLDRIVDALK